MENAIIRVIADALDKDFWNEDSVILDSYYDEEPLEVTCDNYNTYIEDEETAKLIIGDKSYIIRVEEVN